MINLKINGTEVSVKEGTTILEAAKQIDVKIPTLCHLNLHEFGMLNEQASCRVCVVEQVGSNKLIPSCATKCKEGMEILTDSHRAIRARRRIVELLLSNHPNSCLTCAMNMDCELQKLAESLSIREITYEGEKLNKPVYDDGFSIVRDPNKCVLCKRCETMCTQVQTVGALTDIGRGFYTTVGSAFDKPMSETTCTFCGQCLSVCPTGALTELSYVEKVWDAFRDGKHVFVQTAPAIRAALGEAFGMPAGTPVTGKMVTALRRLGFEKVFDTDFAADLTIMEEAAEFLGRYKSGENLPILTSCCPGWVNFFEHFFPELLNIPSSCKSPHEMFAAITKTYLADKLGLDPKDIVLVSIMPCVAKKYEAARAELSRNGISDVDYVLTTRELAAMIKEAGINFTALEDSDFDNPLGESTGAAVIFGTTGGVIEATVRTAYHAITGDDLAGDAVEFHDLRGFDGIKEAFIDIPGLEKPLHIGVAHGLGNTRALLESIRDGKAEFDAIEIMACPGGCIGGAGQPYHHGDISILQKRMNAIYEEDRSKEKRCSYQNEDLKKLYDEFLGEPNSAKAHELLHTSYTARPCL